MKRNILLPTDFSNNAFQAIQYAIQLYRNEDCCFYLLNAVSAQENLLQSLMNIDPGSTIYERAMEHSETELGKLMDQLILDKEGDIQHSFKKISMFNDPIEAIKKVVDQKDIDMVIMGTKGETNNREVIFGSTAVQVMEKVRNCPIIVVPENAKHTMPKEIVFPTAFKMDYKKRELQFLTHIAQRFNAHIIVLYVSENERLSKIQKERKEYLKNIFEDVSHEFRTIHHHDVEYGVNLFTESRDSDMVAFINKKHPFFRSILTSPLVKNISFHSTVPILAMHDLKN